MIACSVTSHEYTAGKRQRATRGETKSELIKATVCSWRNSVCKETAGEVYRIARQIRREVKMWLRVLYECHDINIISYSERTHFEASRGVLCRQRRCWRGRRFQGLKVYCDENLPAQKVSQPQYVPNNCNHKALLSDHSHLCRGAHAGRKF